LLIRLCKRETFVEPTGDAPDHLLDQVAQTGQSRRCAVYAIAMRPGTIDDEQGIGRERSKAFGRDGAGWQVDRAWHVACGERNVIARFNDATGTTPKAWLQHERMARARSLLETSRLDTEQIAQRCGFASAESFRVAFRKTVGLAPSFFRDSFGARHR